jgi:hypothetical protein
VRVKRAAAAERRENDQLKSLIMLRGFNDWRACYRYKVSNL